MTASIPLESIVGESTFPRSARDSSCETSYDEAAPKQEGILHAFERKLDSALTRLIGNRVTALGATTYLASVCWFNSLAHKPASGMEILTHIALSGTAGGLLGITKFGTSAKKFYERTNVHLAKHDGVLDERFVEGVIDGSENGKFIGYCQLQGTYLAARDSDNAKQNLKTFFEAKRKYSNNIIPNF